MLDEFLGQDEKPNPIDAILELLNKENRDSKGNLQMPHIKFLLHSRALWLRKKYPNLSIIDKQEKLMEYYKELMLSYKAMAWEKAIEGLKEMKPQLLEGQIMERIKQ